MPRGSGVHSDSNLTVPNVLTAFRIVLALVAAVCFITGEAQRLAVVMCIVATALDAFDGWYARTFSQCSKLGEHLDPLADKLLMAVVYGVLVVRMASPAIWVLVALIALREVGMTVFRSYSFRRHQKFIPASGLGKAKMIVQSITGVGIITYIYFGGGAQTLPEAAVIVPLVAILALSYISAVDYARSDLRALRRAEALAARMRVAKRKPMRVERVGGERVAG